MTILDNKLKPLLVLSFFGSAALLLSPCGARVGAKAASALPPTYTLSQVTIADASEPSHRTVYVLEGPGRAAAVFEVLDSAPMQDAIASLPPGAEVECAMGGLIPMTEVRQVQALAAFCKQHTLSFSRGSCD